MLNKLKKHKNTIAVLIMIFTLVGVISADLIRNASVSTGKPAASEISPNFIMGTIVETSLNGFSKKSTSQKIFEAIRKDEKDLLSWREDTSVVAKLNSSSVPVSVDLRSIEIISEIISFCRETEGRMDLTVGKLTRLWDFDSGKNNVPSQEDIDAALETVGYQNLKISGRSISIEGEGDIDLGAFGKGIACDRARDVLKESRIRGGTVSVGGSVLVYGEPEKKDAWSIGIRNPDGEATDVFALLEITEESVISTSGMYERGFSKGEDYYHHILDAITGYPVQNDLKSVTIISKRGIISDALSTACFILGYEESLPLLEKFDSRAIFVNKDNSVQLSKGLKSSFSIINEDFKIEE